MGDEKTLWVGSLPNDVSEKELREKFHKCGRVEDVFISRGNDEQFLWGFVEFADSRSRETALFLREDELFLRGQLLKVKRGHRNNPNTGRASSQRSYGRWQGRDDWNRNRWEDRGHRQNGEKSSWQGRSNGYWVDGGDSDYPMKNQVKAGHEGRRVHVGNLPAQVRRVDVERHFRDCGHIEFISLKHKDSESFCFMGFETSKAAEMAVQKLDLSRVYGNQIKVSLSRPPANTSSPKSHRSVEYADWPNEAYHSPTERTRPRDRDGREGSRSHASRRNGRGTTHHRSEPPPTEERRDDVDSEESIDSSDFEATQEGATKVKPNVTEPNSANLANEPQDDEEESSSSSSFCSEDDEKGIDRKEEPQASEAPEMLQATEPADGEGADDSRRKRRRRRKVDENGQPQRSTRKRRKRRVHEAGNSAGGGSTAGATYRSPSRVSRDRSGPTRTLDVKPPLRRKRGSLDQGIRVRVENLPDDMSLDEFRNTGLDFGEVLEVKLWKSSDGSKTGHITFTESTDVARVLSKLDNRRVEGWDRRLHCFVASQV